ncbi:aminotransferase class I/II-fold pyridoxal phosphate-dependent enzyme [Streptomyces noursei]|uniref:aminotransferase class I/II-fold pyridoxal phosphate-dependent enzyme n=1 Tax=Streptomyces noursei TaxID=1971 RepID=UPI00381548BE
MLSRFSMPPEHGADVVATVLEDERLRAAWLGELDGMRHGVTANRADLVAHLRVLSHEEQETSLVRQKAMFSMLPLTPDQMRRVRGQFGTCGTTSGRINVAGVSAHRSPPVTEGIAAVLETPPVPPEGVGRHSRAAGEGWASNRVVKAMPAAYPVSRQ